MPVLPPCYEEILYHFHVLSRSRSVYSETRPSKSGGTYTARRPNPIDIFTILSYNQRVAKVLKDREFLDIIQDLDSIFIMNASKAQA